MMSHLAVCTVAIHSVDVKVRAVGLRREAVIINVDPCSLNPHGRRVHRVHKVSVLGYDTAIV